MGLNETTSGERLHISFFGMRNAGKSSVVNAVTGQEMSIVSDTLGTTTDPVRKTMELLPLGPVVIIDTPGIDDEGELGEKRVKRANDILAKTDIAVVVIDAIRGKTEQDTELIKLIEEKRLPYIVAFNKCDSIAKREKLGYNELYVSAKTGENITELKNMLAHISRDAKSDKRIIGDMLKEGDIVVLVMPIDESAPKGRIILPQVQTMRDILDSHCSFVGCQVEELKSVLDSLAKKPKLVITDSQAFGSVSKIVPKDILLTSFSILLARYKGDLERLVRGAGKLSKLTNNSKVLISEGCTHHRQCNDIGSKKMPDWIRNFSGVEPVFEFTSGGGFKDDLTEYDLIVHCGGCMLNEKEMLSRMEKAEKAGVEIVNYGIAIANMHGILERSLEIFPDLLNKLKN